jgi:hypothetical protein
LRWLGLEKTKPQEKHNLFDWIEPFLGSKILLFFWNVEGFTHDVRVLGVSGKSAAFTAAFGFEEAVKAAGGAAGVEAD